MGVLLSDDLFPAEMRLRGSDAAYVTNLAVASRARRQGVASDLLGAAERFARESGRQTVWCRVDDDNHTARGMYERRGYAPREPPKTREIPTRRFIGVRLRGACALRGSRLRFERLRDRRGRALVRGDDNGAKKPGAPMVRAGTGVDGVRRGGEKEKKIKNLRRGARRVRRVRDGAGVLVRGVVRRARGTPPRARSPCSRWCSRATKRSRRRAGGKITLAKTVSSTGEPPRFGGGDADERFASLFLGFVRVRASDEFEDDAFANEKRRKQKRRAPRTLAAASKKKNGSSNAARASARRRRVGRGHPRAAVRDSRLGCR